MTYTVKIGDTLWDISRRYGVSISSIVNANPIIKDPDLIYGGWKLTIPGKGEFTPARGARRRPPQRRSSSIRLRRKRRLLQGLPAEQTSLRRQMQALEKNTAQGVHEPVCVKDQ